MVRTRKRSGYLLAGAQHDAAVSRIADDRSGCLESIKFATLSPLDVRQESGCYGWEIAEEIPLREHQA